MNSLFLQDDKVIINDETIALDLTNIEPLLAPYPPSDYAWEVAIMHIEDVISPLRDKLLNEHKTYVYQVDELAILPHTIADEKVVIDREQIELAFAVLSGVRYGYDLPNLPQTPKFASQVLILREWGHHLDVGEFVIAK